MVDSLPLLTPGTLLSNRFEVFQNIGRGGFGIVYLAHDLERMDDCVIKELAPSGCYRREDGVMVLPHDGTGESQRLRQRFIDEAKMVSRLNVPGVIPVRAYFHENGTAYYASDYLKGALTLDQVIKQEGRLDAEGALDILFQLVEILTAVHDAGVLHRDIKPTNILIDPKGGAHIIDFGAAREWHADSTTHHTVLFTPGYAPIEQLSEKAPRGPATDIYALCATAYHMLTGEVPPSATDRAAGVSLPSLSRIRSDIELKVSLAIEKGLELHAKDRPRSLQELKVLIGPIETPEEPVDTLGRFDQQAYELQHFSCSSKECPQCREPLVRPKPLKRGICPVCRRGTIKVQVLGDRLCPACKTGALKRVSSEKSLVFCPLCRTGLLNRHKKGVFSKAVSYSCPVCEAVLASEKGELILTDVGKSKSGYASGSSMTSDEWLSESKRSPVAWCCDVCEAQYDELNDGRRLQVLPKKRGKQEAYYPEEWARIAAGLEPSAGNAVCDTCQADFFIEDEKVTLLGALHDPSGFADRYAGRLFHMEDIRWLAVGKISANPGLCCSRCRTELDEGADGFILVESTSDLLIPHIGEERSHTDWCRMGRGLPPSDEEERFELAFDEAIVDAYEANLLDLESRAKGGDIWRSAAERFRCEGDDWIEEGSGQLVVKSDELVFGGLIRKTHIRFKDISSVWPDSGNLCIKLREGATWAFTVPVIHIELSFRSGTRVVQLTVVSLAKRIESCLLR